MLEHEKKHKQANCNHENVKVNIYRSMEEEETMFLVEAWYYSLEAWCEDCKMWIINKNLKDFPKYQQEVEKLAIKIYKELKEGDEKVKISKCRGV